ncbi:MAG: response regulator [Leptospiraceae bacterium]|nr:response regulator [Leptospiraceae bacterium]MCP5494523.1 response regulator [Leptospiraceae bacterium]
MSSLFYQTSSEKEMTDKELIKSKSKFFSLINHKIKTPMNGIIGMVDLLLNTELQDKQKNYAEVIRESGEDLIRIINNVMDLSKIELNALELNQQIFDIKSCLEDVFRTYKAKATFKNVKLSYELEEGLPEQAVGDYHRLRQILLNMVNNAIQHTNQGNVKIFIKKIKEDSDSFVLEFQVQDEGIGMSPDHLRDLFQFDLQSSHHANLGLVICKKLIHKMNGTIWVESTIDKGSTFYFTIQLKHTFGISSIEKKKHKELEETIPSQESKINILVAEDNVIGQKAMQNILSEFGYEAIFVSNGFQVLDKLKERKFDMVFLDIKMPLLDGFQTMQKIKTESLIHNAPIIVAMSTNSLLYTREKCIKAGMQDLLSKPFQKRELKKLIDRWNYLK